MSLTDLSALHIRSASVTDAPRLAVMRYRFRGELAAPTEPEDAFVARATPWIAARLERGDWRAWVAADATGDLIGHLFAHFVEKLPNPIDEAETIVYLTNVYVIPPMRNRGIGTRLMRTALAACRTADVDTIILWPSDRSRPLYRRLGFAPPAALFELPLHRRQEDPQAAPLQPQDQNVMGTAPGDDDVSSGGRHGPA